MPATYLKKGQPTRLTRHQDHIPKICISLGTNIFFYLLFQDPQTEILQKGNKKWQNTSFTDELRGPWDSWKHTLTVTAVIKLALGSIFLKFIGKIIRSPVCLGDRHKGSSVLIL